jgi:D-glycero-alpha-D-manno-heptose 1-phosphate guanylyltransferase
MENLEVIILAGGKGTRLQSVVNDRPKPMADINGKPFLYYIINYIKTFPFVTKIILSIGYKGEQIQSFFGNNFEDIEIYYCNEDTPLGTGGAILRSMKYTTAENVLVINGDTFSEIDLGNFYKFHIQNRSNFTMGLKFLEDSERYGNVVLLDGLVSKFEEKGKNKQGLINAGWYLINKNLFQGQTFQESFSFEKDFIEKELGKFKINGFVFEGYFIDIGIPEDYEKAKNYFLSQKKK